jgi:hypothetical protein
MRKKAQVKIAEHVALHFYSLYLLASSFVFAFVFEFVLLYFSIFFSVNT